MALVIFDLDDTLIHGDCATLWSEQMGRLGWVDPESFMRKNNELMDAYSRGELAMEDFMDFSLEPMIGRTPEEIVASKVMQFAKNRRAIVRRLAEHHQKEIPAEVERFFDAVESGNQMTARLLVIAISILTAAIVLLANRLEKRRVSH